jgi:hypothetical protein
MTSARAERGEFEEVAANQLQQAKPGEAPRPEEMPKPQPEPYHMPSEALRQWKKRLAVVEAEIERRRKEGEPQQEKEDENVDEEGKAEADQYARTDADDDRKGTETTVAPVVESEAMEIPEEEQD